MHQSDQTGSTFCFIFDEEKRERRADSDRVRVRTRDGEEIDSEILGPKNNNGF
jgi:hypothetical protein